MLTRMLRTACLALGAVALFAAPTPQMASACILSFSAMNRAETSPVDSRSILTSRLGRVLFSDFM